MAQSDQATLDARLPVVARVLLAVQVTIARLVTARNGVFLARPHPVATATNAAPQWTGLAVLRGSVRSHLVALVKRGIVILVPLLTVHLVATTAKTSPTSVALDLRRPHVAQVVALRHAALAPVAVATRRVARVAP